MAELETNSHFDLYLIRNFLDTETCAELIGEMRCASAGPATVYGMSEAGSVDERVRKVTRVRPSEKTVERVRERLLESSAEVGEYFGISLSVCEEPQFLRYRVGDFFVAHQDGNTGLIRSEREESRKISTVIFLNNQSEAPEADAFCGGSLVFSDWRARQEERELRLSAETGMLVAFRAETTHEVVPVTHGERYSIVSWYG